MKHFFTLGVAMLAAFALSAQAKTKVTLKVDMKNTTVDKVVNLAGDLMEKAGLGANWSPQIAGNELKDDDKDGIWEITFDIEPGTYAYKFVNGDGGWEEVPGACASGGNRRLVVGSTAVTQQFCFGTCDDKCAQVTDVRVTLRVNMKNETISPDGVHVAGSFQGFNPGATKMSDDDKDGIYEVTLTMKNGTYGYKFINGNAWGKDESVPCSCIKGNNREIVVPFTNQPVVSQVVCFRSCTNTCPATDDTEVTFSVDMSGEAVQTSGLYVAGSFQKPNQWQKNLIRLTDPDNDGIYTAKAIVQRVEQQYKFFNGDFTKHPSNVGKKVEDMNSDIYAENFDFTAGRCGCGDFKNRIFDGSAFSATAGGRLPVYVYNSCQTITVSTNDLSSARNIRVYPNPMTGQYAYIEFEGLDASEHSAVVADQLGRIVRTYSDFSGTQLQIEKGNLTPGIYFVTLQNRKGERATTRLTIQ